MLAKID